MVSLSAGLKEQQESPCSLETRDLHGAVFQKLYGGGADANSAAADGASGNGEGPPPLKGTGHVCTARRAASCVALCNLIKLFIVSALRVQTMAAAHPPKGDPRPRLAESVPLRWQTKPATLRAVDPVQVLFQAEITASSPMLLQTEAVGIRESQPQEGQV